jgi:hypothetical protein
MFEVHFSISDNILTMSLGSSFFFWCLYNTLAEKVCFPLRNGLVVRGEEQAKKVLKIFPTNEIARNKICSADLLNGHVLEESWMCRRE